MTLPKLRQVCASSFIIPRLLNQRYAADRLDRLSIRVQKRFKKTTRSDKNDKGDSARCQRIIDLTFSINQTEDTVEIDPKLKGNRVKMVTPEYTTCKNYGHNQEITDSDQKRIESDIEIVSKEPTAEEIRCARIINEIFGDELDKETVDLRNPAIESRDPNILTELHATTARETVEALELKVENINEEPLVEAPTTKVANLNVQPKPIGNRQRNVGRLSSLDKTFLRRMKGIHGKDEEFDELAKRCLDSQSNIDERLLKEMERLGVPPTSNSSMNTRKDIGIVQPEIMRIRTKPASKEINVFTTDINEYDSKFPHPFELLPVKANSHNIDSVEIEENFLLLERILPVHSNHQNMPDMDAVSENDLTKNLNSEERTPQQLLGHMTAAVVSDETYIDENRRIMKHLLIKQEEEKQTNYKEESVSSERVLVERTLLSKLKGTRSDKYTDNMLSDVDPKEIAVLQEYKEVEMLRNLLQTRMEYLEQEKIRRLNSESDVTECKHTALEDENDSKQFVESGRDGTLKKLDGNNLKIEMVNESLTEDLEVKSNHPEPGIVVGESTYKTPVSTPNTFKSYSEKRGMISAHQFFEELSVLSNETEIGVGIDDVSEIDKDISKAESLVQSSKTPKFTPNNCMDTDEQADKDKIKPYEHVTQSIPEPLFLASEMSRMASPQEKVLLAQKLSPDLFPSRPPVGQATGECAIPQDTTSLPNHEPQTAKTVTNEKIFSTMLDKGPIVAQKLNPNTSVCPEDALSEEPSDVKASIEDVKEQIPLSEMLRRVREQNRKQIVKQAITEVGGTVPELEPVVGKCGKKPRCPPSAPTCPPPTPVCPPPVPTKGPVCPAPPQPKTPCPKPCQPKCRPPCQPRPCNPKPRKNPCDKFSKHSLNVENAVSLLLYCFGLLPQKSWLPALVYMVNGVPDTQNTNEVNKLELTFSDLHNFQKVNKCDLEELVYFNKFVSSLGDRFNGLNALKTASTSKDFSKSYEPWWTPIPSWPVPVKKDKKKLSCPKDGCKVDPPKLNPPCKDVNPCVNLPKRHFSVIEFMNAALGALNIRKFASEGAKQ